MRSLVKLSVTGMLAISVLPVFSCVNIAALSVGDVLSGLSDLIMAPYDDCAELRRRFRVEYLPVVDDPSGIGLKYEQHWLTTPSGARLQLWYLPANLDRGTVVYSIGSAGDMRCYLFSADLLVGNGWSVVMYDYEGFGLSGGTASLDTLISNLTAAVAWARTHTGRDRITLMGMSLGSIPSVAVAVQQPDSVNGVILDSPVALKAQIERFGFLIPGQAGILINRLDANLLSDVIIERLQQPLLVFSHELDPISTPDTVAALFESAGGPKVLVNYPGVGHASSQFVRTDSYLYYLDTFLNDIWLEEATLAETRLAAQ
jgi:pimeloyl-ACP methyl ester carboxylesterase